MRIYMIRHGRQCSNLCNVDVELSEEGHKQATLAGERLKTYGVQGLYCSHLTRAVQTAQHISEVLRLPITEVDDIEEIHFGQWTGKSDAELDAKYPEERKQYSKGLRDITYEDGENGERCYQRYEKGMKWLVEDALSKEYESIAVVTHGIAMRSFLCGILGIPFAKRGTFAKSLENGSIMELRYEDGQYYLERFNDYAHIEPYDELMRKHFK